MGVIAKRSSMTFFSDPVSHYSHRVRIVLAEKQVTVDLIDVDGDNLPEDLVDLNPYSSLPTLVDRDLVLYESDIIMEYLDERFPHPPLFPVYPVARAQSRLWMYRVRREWCALVDPLLANEGDDGELEAMRGKLRDSLIATAPIFGEKPFFMSDEFTIVDCCVTPILWRLPVMGIELPENRGTRPLIEYRERLFNRDSVKASLSELEREMSA